MQSMNKNKTERCPFPSECKWYKGGLKDPCSKEERVISCSGFANKIGRVPFDRKAIQDFLIMKMRESKRLSKSVDSAFAWHLKAYDSVYTALFGESKD